MFVFPVGLFWTDWWRWILEICNLTFIYFKFVSGTIIKNVAERWNMFSVHWKPLFFDFYVVLLWKWPERRVNNRPVKFYCWVSAWAWSKSSFSRVWTRSGPSFSRVWARSKSSFSWVCCPLCLVFPSSQCLASLHCSSVIKTHSGKHLVIICVFITESIYDGRYDYL